MDLPRNLYKSPGSITFNATKSYDTIFVENMAEYDAGIDAGYIDVFAGALNQKVVKAEIKEVVKEVVKEVAKKVIPKKEKPIVKEAIVKEKAPSFDDDF